MRIWLLALLAFSVSAHAESTYWYSTHKPTVFFANPGVHCALLARTEVNTPYFRLTDDPSSQTRKYCDALGTLQQVYKNYVFLRATCPNGGNFDPETKSCVAPVKCETTAGKVITKALTCDYIESLKTYVCDSQIEQDGCLYTGGSNKKCVADLTTGKGICTAEFFGSGESATDGTEPCTAESCTPATPPSEVPPAEEQCVTNGGVTICHNPQNPGCGSVNGQEGCFQEAPGCGYFNGTYQCVDADKPQKNCGYFNGKQTCTDPKDPTKIIPETSPDHPKNGGNADGNQNNDPKAPGDTSGSPQGSDQGATNEAIGELGEELGGKIDKTNGLLDGIKGILDGIAEGIGELTEGILGDEYDGSGDGNGDALEGIGQGLGEGLAGDFGEQLAAASAEQSEADETFLDGLADSIDGDDWFGDGSLVANLLDFGKDILPRPAGCSDYVIQFNLGRYAANIRLPVCSLASIKPLLEWLIYAITLIGLWKIAYSTLRMEDVKASKGGF